MARAGCWEELGSSTCPGITEVNGILAIVFNGARISLHMPKKALYPTVVLSAMTFTANEISVPHLTWLLVYLYRSSPVVPPSPRHSSLSPSLFLSLSLSPHLFSLMFLSDTACCPPLLSSQLAFLCTLQGMCPLEVFLFGSLSKLSVLAAGTEMSSQWS